MLCACEQGIAHTCRRYAFIASLYCTPELTLPSPHPKPSPHPVPQIYYELASTTGHE